MNPAPRYKPAHMRAKFAGFQYAYCFNCKHILEESPPWCEKKAKDPTPSQRVENTLCKEYEPREP